MSVQLPTRSRVTLGVVAVTGVTAFAWPLLFAPASGMDPAQAPSLFALVLPLVLAVVIIDLSGDVLDVKALALLGVLCALGSVLRPLSAGTAGMDLIFFVLILGGRVFGPGFGFAQGALTLFSSALLTGGVGPWLPYQMLAAGFVGLGAGGLPRTSPRVEMALLCVYGFGSAFAYGWLMDFAFWPYGLGPATQFSFDPNASAWQNLQTFALFNLATSMGWNLGRAITNVVLILLVGPSMLRILGRTARRAILQPVPRSAEIAEY